jgi:hypothetical protein
MVSHHGGRRALIVVILLLAAASTTHAQAPTTKASRFTLWIGGGYGRGVAGQFEGAEEAFTVNVSAQQGHLLLSSRIAAVSSSIFDTSWDLGLLAGLASSPTGPIHMGAGLGLGYAEPTASRGVFTVPVELQLFWRATRFVGVGLYGFATLNGTDSFGGAALAFQLGRLR